MSGRPSPRLAGSQAGHKLPGHAAREGSTRCEERNTGKEHRSRLPAFPFLACPAALCLFGVAEQTDAQAACFRPCRGSLCPSSLRSPPRLSCGARFVRRGRCFRRCGCSPGYRARPGNGPDNRPAATPRKQGPAASPAAVLEKAGRETGRPRKRGGAVPRQTSGAVKRHVKINTKKSTRKNQHVKINQTASRVRIFSWPCGAVTRRARGLACCDSEGAPDDAPGRALGRKFSPSTTRAALSSSGAGPAAPAEPPRPGPGRAARGRAGWG